MAAASTVERDRILAMFRGTQHPALPANTYLALFTSATGPGAEGTEVTGGSYARKAIATTTAGWSAPTGTTTRSISNAAVLTFATATAAWGTVSHWALMDALTGGNRLAYGAFAEARVVNSGNIFTVAIGALVLEVA
jgi:hypothetical protein